MSTTLGDTTMPTRHRLKQLMSDLLDIDVMLGDGVAPPPRSSNVVGVYTTARLATVALIVTDFDAAARLGGCCAGFPRIAVQEAVGARELPPVVLRKLQTLFDHLAQGFGPDVTMYEMYQPGAAIPPDIAALAGAVGQRADIKVGVPGYGTGLMSVILR